MPLRTRPCALRYGIADVPPFLLVLLVGFAILIPVFAHLRPVLVDAQPAFQLLGAALLLGRRVPFTLLFAQGFKFLLQGVVTRPGRIVRVSHSKSSLSSRGGRFSHQIAPAAA